MDSTPSGFEWLLIIGCKRKPLEFSSGSCSDSERIRMALAIIEGVPKSRKRFGATTEITASTGE